MRHAFVIVPAHLALPDVGDTRHHGPGGQTPFQLPDGSWRLAYHAWDDTIGYNDGGKRTLQISPMTFSGTPPNQNPTIG